MSYAILILLATGTWLSFFLATRLGMLDPHNLGSGPKFWAPALRATVSFAALALVVPASDSHPNWVPFLTMFVLAQTVALPFTYPDVFRADEIPSVFGRKIAGIKSSVAGSLFVKVVSLVLAFLTAWLIGDWWFVLVIWLGYVLISGKGLTALLMIESEEGEFSGFDRAAREKKKREWIPVVAWGRLGYVVASAAFGAALFRYSGLEAYNWMGWTGLLSGAIFHALMPAD